jgi:S-DNA-T family DNA segregation ATPase FtsK/SpoIIIE
MELAITSVTVTGDRRDLLVHADTDRTVAELAAAIAKRLGLSEDTPLYLGARLLPPLDRIGGVGMAQGTLIGVGVPAADPEPAAAPLEVAVIGGPGAGVSVPIHPGEQFSIGRAGDDGLVVADDQASRKHALIVGSPDGAVVSDNGSRNGVGWNGFRLHQPQPLVDGDVFQVGQSVVALRQAAPAAAVLDPPDPAGNRRFHRPPRLPRPDPANELDVPSEPEKPGGRHFPLASMLAPIAIGVVLVVVTKSLTYAAFMLLSPVMLGSNYISDRRHGRKEYEEKLAEYQAASASLADNLAALVAAEERARRIALPDPAALARMALAPTARLWERRPEDPDFLAVRVGLTDVPANVRLKQPPASASGGAPATDPPVSRHVPVAFDLAGAGIAGVAGPRAAALHWVRAALVQLAVLHGPQDVHIVVLTGQDTAGDWNWALMLPHLVPPDPGWGCQRLVGAGRQQVEDRLATLGRLVDERVEAARDQLRSGPPAGPRLLVVVDGARRLRAAQGMADLLRRGPEAGVVALCLDDHEDNLPEECRVTVVWPPESADAFGGGGRSRVTLRVHGRQPVEGIFADGCSEAVAHQVARALAPIRDPDQAGGPGGVPRTVRLLDLVGPDPPTGRDVVERWRATRDGRSTEAVIGAQAGGSFSVDLRRDGPHALVAGTTGAGKSELLQTLVASLALANRPDGLTFVLVDYKGGSAFKECRLLPHCVGMVTDLDGHLAGRALASLSAELKRRETVLAQVGAKDLEDYWGLTAGGGAVPLARLAIVIDEFATLVEEVPEFVRGVVGIGMRGRSLGVHVILATQRPAGVVSAEMRANVNLRICLRVANPQESSDVIDLPDASRIGRDLPGRGYVLAGYHEVTLFQAARVGGVRPAVAASGSAGSELRVDLMTPAVMGQALSGPVVAIAEEQAEPAGPTDLGLIVAAVQEATAAEGVAAAASPWLPPLPEVIPLDSLPAGGGGPLQAVIGAVDRPERQAQEPFAIDLGAWGSLLVVGAVRSGRSTALRTIAARLCTATGPDSIHLYALDAGNRALEPLAGLPHFGAVVTADDAERTSRLMDMLTALVADRSRTGAAEPPVVVLVDRLEAFLSRYGDRDSGRLVESLDSLLREGPAVGVHFVISGDRTAFTSRLASAIESRLVLRQADRADYAVFGLDPRVVPSHMPNGRAVWAQSGHEVQIGVLGPADTDGTDAGQVAALEGLAVRHSALAPAAGRRPRRLERLPERITVSELAGPPGTGSLGIGSDEALQGNAVAILGVGGDELTPVRVDLVDVGPGFVIAGPPRAGRSTALATVVRTLTGRESGQRPVILVTPRQSPLRELAGWAGIAASLSGGPDLAEQLPAALAAAGRPAALVIDDAELLADGPVARVLEGVVRTARDDDVVVIAAATTDDLLLSRFRGWLADARRSRCGLLLTPASATDGEVFDLRLPRSTGGHWPAGRGLLAVRGQTSTIQVALPE